LTNPLALFDISQFPVIRSRYVLQDPDGNYLLDANGVICATSNPEDATVFVDLDVAIQRAQALIRLGIPVKQVTFFSSVTPNTNKPVNQAQPTF